MTKSEKGRCYFCGKPATSSEHVPPRCLFPEQKDISDEDFRRNLITVPSCDVHNMQKSREDEFLMACLAPIVGNNEIGYFHTQTKLARARSRNPHLIAETIRDPINLNLKSREGKTFPVLLGQPDMPRLCKALEAVARGLYFHTKGKRFKGKVQVLPVFVKYRPGATIDICQLLAEIHTEQERKDWPEYGENPKIFSFQIGTPDQFGLTPMVMTFYSRAEVLAAFQPKGGQFPLPKLSEATPEKPIDVEIIIGEGDDAQKLNWKCDGR
jgi:hypothetical protein